MDEEDLDDNSRRKDDKAEKGRRPMQCSQPPVHIRKSHNHSPLFVLCVYFLFLSLVQCIPTHVGPISGSALDGRP